MEKDTVVLESGIEVPIAVYKDQGTVDYNGNPLIEALPTVLSRKKPLNNYTIYHYTMRVREIYLPNTDIMHYYD